jgi:outer membrane protein assembly factor BamB
MKWRFKTGEDHKISNQVGIQSSAAVADGTVYFGCRDSHLYALDAKTGEKKWAYDNKGTWIIASPAVRDKKVYVTSSDPGLLYAFDAATGKQIFSMDDKRWIMFSSPAIAGNVLYVGAFDGTLRAIDLASGKIAWKFETEAAHQRVAALSKPDGSTNYDILFHDDFADDMAYAVHELLTTGAILTSPIVVGDTVYFGSSDGNLYAVN